MRRMRVRDIALPATWIAVVCGNWAIWLLPGRNPHGELLGLACLSAGIVGMAYATLIGAADPKAPFAAVAVMMGATIACLLGLFSGLYWSIGTHDNFSHALTRLDAIYFAVGTLSTAGTGDLSATSQQARLIQTSEMLLAMVVVLFVVGAVVARFITASAATEE
jgi:Ion channel